MKKGIVTIILMGFMFAAFSVSAAQVRNHKWCKNGDGLNSWTCGYSFSYQGSNCGLDHCKIYRMDAGYAYGWGGLVYIKIERNYPLYVNNWFWWDDVFGKWQNECDLEGYYSQNSTWKYYIGKNVKYLTAANTFLTYYHYYNGGTRYFRMYKY